MPNYEAKYNPQPNAFELIQMVEDINSNEFMPIENAYAFRLYKIK